MTNQPDYYIGALDKETGAKNPRIGVDGVISVKLNAFVTLTGSDDLVIKLWPNTEKARQGAKQPSNPKPGYEPQELDDEIPF